MVRFKESAIVVDLSAHLAAFKIDPGVIWLGPQRLVPFHDDCISQASYVYVEEPRGTRILMEINPWSGTYKCPYVDVKGGIEGGITNYAIPAANPTIDTPLGPMPRHRHLGGVSVWNYSPRHPYMYFHPLNNGKFLIDSLSVRVDIIDQAISIQVPYEDWLAKPENDVYVQRARRLKPVLQVYECGKELDNAVAYIILRLGGNSFLDLPTKGLTKSTLEALKLADEICTVLDLPEGTIKSIGGSEVADFWKQKMAKYQGKSITKAAWDKWLKDLSTIKQASQRPGAGWLGHFRGVSLDVWIGWLQAPGWLDGLLSLLQ